MLWTWKPVLLGGLFLAASCGQLVIVRGQEDGNSAVFWLSQAHASTEDLSKEAVSLQASDRARLWGQLAKLWWSDDRDLGRSYMKKAIQQVASVPNRENPDERRQRMDAVRALVGVASFMDKDFSVEIDAILAADSSGQSNEEATANATALVQAALGILDKDTARAATLGAASLRVGRSPQIVYLLSELRKRDRALGDSLFLEALSAARTASDKTLLLSLASVAFNGPAPSDNIQKQVLLALTENLAASQIQKNSDVSPCSVASFASSLMTHFQRLVPSQVETVRAAVLRCGSEGSASRPTSTGETFDSQLKTVNDFWRAANETSDQKRRVFLLSRAVYLSAAEKNFERAVTILDEFSNDERAQLNGAWENWRWEFASSAAVARLKRGDSDAADRIVLSTPVNLRAYVEISIVTELAAPRDSQKAIELLQSARRGLSKEHNANTVEWYLSLLRRYLKFMPQEAPSVFRELIKVINQAEPSERSSGELQEGGSRNLGFQPISIPATLLEIDIGAIRSAVSDTASTSMRIRLKLALLASSLELFRSRRQSVKPTVGSGF